MENLKCAIIGCRDDVLRVLGDIHAHHFAVVTDRLQRLPSFAPNLKRKKVEFESRSLAGQFARFEGDIEFDNR